MRSSRSTQMGHPSKPLASTSLPRSFKPRAEGQKSRKTLSKSSPSLPGRKHPFKRMNSTPSVRTTATSFRKPSLATSAGTSSPSTSGTNSKSASTDDFFKDTNNDGGGGEKRSSKTVRIDEAIQIRRFEEESHVSTLIRRKSFESMTGNKSRRQKSLENFFPRRRFSQSAIEPIRDLLMEMEAKSDKHKQEMKAEKPRKSEDSGEEVNKTKAVESVEDDVPFYSLSEKKKISKLKEYAKKFSASTHKYDDSWDWWALKSLTGINVSGWKYQDNFYGHLKVGKRPSIDTAWGRRIYDQYEIELPVDRNGSKGGKSKVLGEDGVWRACVEPRDLGLWDIIFSHEIIPRLEDTRGWDPHSEDRAKEIRKLKLDGDETVAARLEHEVVISPNWADDPVGRYKMRFMRTGEYLRPHDMRYCVENTNFSEEQIIDWFKRFRKDCPDGRLTRDHLRRLFRQAFPDGNAEKFSGHIMRIFDRDGNLFLDFKEFLMAIDVATCETEESKLKWAFKLFDYDNNGSIEVTEMINIMETLESLEDVSLITKNERKITYDESGNPVPVATPAERARDLFEALDKTNQGFLTMEAFVEGYMERNELMARQDAQEQRRKLNCLLFRGPVIPNPAEVSHSRIKFLVANLISKRTGVSVEADDLDFVSVREINETTTCPNNNNNNNNNNDESNSNFQVQQITVRSVFARFYDRDLRSEVWAKRAWARRNGLVIEEYLTATRQKIWSRCKELKATGKIDDIYTRNGDIIVVMTANEPAEVSNELSNTNKCSSNHMIRKYRVVTDTQFEKFLKLVKGIYIGTESDLEDIRWKNIGS